MKEAKLVGEGLVGCGDADGGAGDDMAPPLLPLRTLPALDAAWVAAREALERDVGVSCKGEEDVRGVL